MSLGAALDGVRVVDLTRLVPGPYGTLILADLGAEVVKIEEPGIGDYLRLVPPLTEGVGARFRALNRGKRSLCLDLRQAEGREVLLRLAARADVVVEGFRPGVMDRLGVGFGALCAVNPRLILCSITGYGQTGPWAGRAGHDLNFLALSGVLHEMSADGPPRPPPLQIADLVGGGLFGALLVLAALAARTRDPRPRHLDVSMTEGVMSLLGPELAELLAAGPDRPGPGQGLLTGGHALYGVYPTADRQLLSVAALEPKFAAALGDRLGLPVRADDLMASFERRTELRESVAAATARRSLDELEATLGGVDACTEPVLRPEALATHPQHAARGTLRGGAGPGGLSTEGPVHTPGAPAPPDRRAPRLGEHGRQILAELGYASSEIEHLAGIRAVDLPAS
jgi:crotonobetainyl-CoA:carnitine CoA-transferase CaiB-like acyl-CoA transferase